MKRSGPPRRKTPLRSDPDKQREWERKSRRQRINAKRKPPSKTKLRAVPNAGTIPVKAPRKRGSRVWYEACRLVDLRSGGMCEANVPEACPDGRHRAHHHHHVWLRGQGGPDAEWNLLHVCNPAHTWIHGHPTLAKERGLIRRGRAVS